MFGNVTEPAGWFIGCFLLLFNTFLLGNFAGCDPNSRDRTSDPD
jgi:hypothetical protein